MSIGFNRLLKQEITEIIRKALIHFGGRTTDEITMKELLDFV
jgi:hypothetical protein